jgi:hypothetical protein
MTSPGSSSSDCNIDHSESRSTGIGNGAIDIVRNSVSVLSRCYTDMRPSNDQWNHGYSHLPDNCALENHEHEEGEKAVVPIFVEHPQGHAEDLEDEERSGSMLRK